MPEEHGKDCPDCDNQQARTYGRRATDRLVSENNHTLRNLLMSVFASLIVAGTINFIAFYAAFSKLTVTVEHIERRVSTLEDNYKTFKTETKELQFDIVRFQQNLEVMMKDVREIKTDHKLLLKALGSLSAQQTSQLSLDTTTTATTTTTRKK